MLFSQSGFCQKLMKRSACRVFCAHMSFPLEKGAWSHFVVAFQKRALKLTTKVMMNRRTNAMIMALLRF
jgi:hypothetical protein